MPRARRALAICLSLGATAGVLAFTISAPPSLAQQTHHGNERHAEAREAEHSAPVRSDLDALVVLAQMQGHLLVAKELLQQQNFSAAEPHVAHPVDELYGPLAPALQRRGLAPFLPTLEALRQQVRLHPNTPETAHQLTKAQQAIAAAARSMNGGAPTPAPLVLSIVRELGESAAEEYGSAIAGDRVLEVIDYQDALGFLLEAQRLLAEAMAKQPADAPTLMARQRTVTAMLKAFPTVMPPPKAALSVARMQELQKLL